MILQILEKIGSDTKRSHKLALIKEHRDNALFMKVVKMALDPYLNFYIRKIPDYDPKGGKTLDWALVELEKLSSRQFTGNAGIEHLRNIMSNVSSDDSTVISRIIGKDLRCGMAEGIVNAVVKGYIPGYPCLLARGYDEKNIKNIKYPAFSQLKADGLRVNFHIDGNTVFICGRSGRAIDLLGYMDANFISLGKMFDSPVVIDGELVVVDEMDNILPRKIGNGIINRAIKGTISEEEAKMVRAQLWDVIPSAQFKKGISDESYETRFNSLICAIKKLESSSEDAVMRALRGQTQKYWVIPYRVVESLDEAQEHFNELLEKGEEGTILKNMSGIWEDARSKDLVKLKAERDCDLEIIGWNPGNGKYEDQVGSLICASSDRKVEVSISGFSEDLRLEITKNINILLGTIVSVLYNERIASKGKDRQGVDSLFLPRFICFREDKVRADSSAEIK